MILIELFGDKLGIFGLIIEIVGVWTKLSKARTELNDAAIVLSRIDSTCSSGSFVGSYAAVSSNGLYSWICLD